MTSANLQSAAPRSRKTETKSSWKTYAIYGYTYDVANDRASQGGVHCCQVRRTASGLYQTRIEQSNGRYSSFGPVRPVSREEGEARLATAEQQNLD